MGSKSTTSPLATPLLPFPSQAPSSSSVLHCLVWLLYDAAGSSPAVGEGPQSPPSGLLTREHVGDPARSWNRTGEQRRSSPASGISVCRSVSSYSSATGIQTETNTGGRPNPSSIDPIWPREVSGVEAPRNGSLRVRMIDARHQHQADRYHFHSTPRRGKISRLHGHCRGGSCGS